MASAARLLGLAFASADCLLELDEHGVITLALGAGPTSGTDLGLWTGSLVADHLVADSRDDLANCLMRLPSGVRSGELKLAFATDQDGSRMGRLKAFRLPQNGGAISCAITWGAVAAHVGSNPAELLDARGLIERVRRIVVEGAAKPLDVAFVAVAGLAGDSDQHVRASERVEAVLQTASLEGSSAAKLAQDRFALLRGAEDATDIPGEVREAGRAEGLVLEAEVTQDRLDPAAEGDMVMRALRLALDGCVRDGLSSARFGERLASTVRSAEKFSGRVQTRDFRMVYQPIVDLMSRDVRHFEALARFGAESPAAAIRMAEELNIVEAFDLAVVEKVSCQLKRPGFGTAKAAVNVSGRSLAGGVYVDRLVRLAETEPGLKGRLIVEITETAALADLDNVELKLGALRNAGYQLCVDDFGVGAASFEYLRRLSLDTVKIDGVFVRDLGEDARARKLIDHLVKLCADLKVTTVAEMVETEAQASELTSLGGDVGQGWLFGRPLDEPRLLPSGPQAAAVRRVGEVSGWG